MKAFNRGRRLLALGALTTLAVAGAALSAEAGSKLQEHSKTAKVASSTSQALRAKCGKDGLAASAGFAGRFDASLSPPAIHEALPVQQTISGRTATARLANVGQPAKVSGYAYCGGPSLTAVSRTATIDSEQPKSVTATCAGDRTAYSGGFKTAFEIVGEDPTGAVAVGSYRSSRNAWKTTFISPGGDPTRITSYVYCARAKALAVRSKSHSISLSLGGSEPAPINGIKRADVIARCKRGELPISGGFRPQRVNPQSGPLAIGSRRASATAWTVRMAAMASPDASENAKAKLTAFVYCSK